MASRALPENYNLESVARMAAVLKALEHSDGVTLDKVAQLAELSESTALRYLSSLTTHDLVERDLASGRYRLGLSLFRLGTAAVNQRDIIAVAAPLISELQREFEETVNLAARQRNQVFLLHVSESPRSLKQGKSAGGTDAWHATSLGKALLSGMPDGEIDAILSSIQYPRFTPNTIVSEEALRRDIAASKTRGYAIDDEESDEGLRCVGIAVLDHAGIARYGLSVSGPKSRMSYARIAEIGEHLTQTSRQLSASLGLVRSASTR